MRYTAASDRAAHAERLRRERQEARDKAFAELQDNARRLGYSLVKHCPQCKSVRLCMCSR